MLISLNPSSGRLLEASHAKSQAGCHWCTMVFEIDPLDLAFIEVDLFWVVPLLAFGGYALVICEIKTRSWSSYHH